MKSLKDYIQFISENEKEILRVSSGYSYDESSLIRGEGLSVYPIQEMAYTRGDWSSKVENLTYQIAENTILICSAFEQEREEQFRYWCKELFNKFIRTLAEDVIKKKNSYAERSSILKQKFYEVKEIHKEEKVKRFCVAAQDKEREEAERRAKRGEKCYPIKVNFSRSLFENYIGIIKFCVEYISNSEFGSMNEFIENLENILK